MVIQTCYFDTVNESWNINVPRRHDLFFVQMYPLKETEVYSFFFNEDYIIKIEICPLFRATNKN